MNLIQSLKEKFRRRSRRPISIPAQGIPPTLGLEQLDAVVAKAAKLLRQGKNAALIGPPGCGTTSLAHRVAELLGKERRHVEIMDCSAPGKVQSALGKGPEVLVIDQVGGLSPADQGEVISRVRSFSGQMLWVGCIDIVNALGAPEEKCRPGPDAHVQYPTLARDEVLGIYRRMVESKDSGWGEPLLYLAYDWCGDDLRLFENFLAAFYGDWTAEIYDKSIEEGLDNWIAGPPLNVYRSREKALGPDAKRWIRHALRGGKVRFHRPEPHLETSSEVRELFLSGFLCPDLIPGYYRFRNLAAAFVAAEGTAFAARPIEMFRRASNSRVNALLQDVELALRASLRDAVASMPPGEWKKKLQDRPSEKSLFLPDLSTDLGTWLNAQPPGAPTSDQLASEMQRLDKKYRAANNLWSEVQRRYAASTKGTNDLPELASIDYFTFHELAEWARKVDGTLYKKDRAGPVLQSQLKLQWEAHLALVNRLRNDAAHLRNISFQDMQELVHAVSLMRRDQIRFGTEVLPP